MFGQTLKDIKKNMDDLQSSDSLIGSANATSNLSAFIQTIRGVKAEIISFPRNEVENIFSTFNSKSKDGLQVQIDYAETLSQNKKSVSDYLLSLNGAEPTFQGYSLYCQQATQSNKKFKLSTIALNGALQALQSIGIGILITLASIAVTKIVEAVDEAIITFDELNEQIEEHGQNYENLTAELKNINSELETTQERIEELNRLDKLSVVEV